MSAVPKLNNGIDYIDSTDYTTLENKLTALKSVLEDVHEKQMAARKLRYAEVDIEVEREASRIAPDELYIPQHLIDTNIRREQAAYVKYITQSSRAVITKSRTAPNTDMALLDRDLTDRIRYDGWQLQAYPNIDGFQANGYNIMEVVLDQNAPGGVSDEMVQMGDFAFIADTRDLQASEMLCRQYYYTKTQLLKLTESKNKDDVWDKEQVMKVIDSASQAVISDPGESTDYRDRSLYRIQKVMFRVKGTVHVGWACIQTADGWLRKPRPLYVGRRKLVQENQMIAGIKKLAGAPPASENEYEQMYPYFLYPYLISENNTISHLKGRIYLDQDVQEAITSLMSSTCTQARRAAGMYFSKDVDDPNDDILLQKNIFFRSGALINKKVQAFKLDAPDPAIFSAIQMLSMANQNETSMVNFAVMNRKDSRKTKKELDLAENAEQELTTIQVVLYANALRQQYQYESDIIKSRVQAGLIKVDPTVRPLYDHVFTVKPSGDVDVVEKEQLIQAMMQTWPIISQTAAAPIFLSILLEKMFPENAQQFIQAIQQQTQQQQSQQGQQQQMMNQMLLEMGNEVITLSKHADFFSEQGRVAVYPQIQMAAEKIAGMKKQMGIK